MIKNKYISGSLLNVYSNKAGFVYQYGDEITLYTTKLEFNIVD